MKKVILFSLAVLAIAGCKGKSEDEVKTETASENTQQIGDMMASVDEFGVTGGTIAFHSEAEKMMARLAPENLMSAYSTKGAFWNMLNATTEAASCTSIAYAACNSNSRKRTFANCTVGSLAVSGDVTLTWGGSSVNCAMGGTGDTIARVPNFQVEGRLGATLFVTKSGTTGQRLVLQAGGNSLTYASDGIRRVFNANGSTILDYTTTTGSPLTVTGLLRNGRVVSSGSIVVTDNLKGTTCTYTPSMSGIQWGSAGCNCPTAGTWNVVCRDGSNNVTQSFDLIHGATSCGAANISADSTLSTVNFDRCGS